MTSKEEFADEFASALTADTMDSGARAILTGSLLLDPTGEHLRGLLENDLKTPVGITPVVFRRTRDLLMVKHKPPGLGQFDWLTFGLTKLVDVGTSIGSAFVSNMLKEDLLKTQAAEQLRIEQERTKQAALAAATAQAQATGMAKAGLIPGLPDWAIPVGIGVVLLFGGLGKTRRNPRHRKLAA